MKVTSITQKLAAVGISLAVAVTIYAQGLPKDLDAQSRARLPYLTEKELDAKAKPIYDIFKTKDGKLNGPLAFAAYNGGVGEALLNLHNAAVAGTLDAHARELAILVACRATNYNLEWNGHLAAAKRAGVDDKVIEVVRSNGSVNGLDDQDATIIRFGRQLYNDKKVDSATFAKVVQYWGKRGSMDMVAVMNTYAVSGFFAIAVDERPAEGQAALPVK